jgi:hypothetical protein
MTNLKYCVLAAALALSGPALAQSSTTASPSSGTQSGSQAATLATANKIKQDLQTAGFQEVKVVAESFVVQAKTKDGDPIVMTIGPHGMTVFEALNNASGSSASAGANAGSSSSSGASGHK